MKTCYSVFAWEKIRIKKNLWQHIVQKCISKKYAVKPEELKEEEKNYSFEYYF